jgi:hypothetical protein
MDVSKQGSPEDEDMMAGLRRRMQLIEQKRAAEEAKNNRDDQDADEDSDSSPKSSAKPTQRRDPGSKRKGRPASGGSAVLSRPDRPDNNRENNSRNTSDKDASDSRVNDDAETEDPDIVRFASNADIERLKRMFGSNNTSSKGQL